MSGSSYGDDADIEGTLTVNDDGADKDVRIESDNNTHMLFVDAGNDTVGIGTSTAPPKTLTIEFANDNATVATGHALGGGGNGGGGRRGTGVHCCGGDDNGCGGGGGGE